MGVDKSPLIENDYQDYTALEMGGPGGAGGGESAVEAHVRRSTRRQSKIITPIDHARLSETQTAHGENMDGLSSARAEQLLEQWGKNELPEERMGAFAMFMKQFYGVMPACIILCAILSAVAEDWKDLVIILILLLCNACIGFREEAHAQAALDKLRGDLVAEIQTKRDGRPISMDITFLVPGDIIQLKGGDIIPADSRWIHGDKVKVDTAPLTGEPIPWNVPRPDPAGEPGKGKLLWSGCTIANGECLAEVEKTGIHTEIGSAMAAAGEHGGAKTAGFEQKITAVVSIIITVAFLVAIAIFVVQLVAREIPLDAALLAAVALLVGSVPIALPLVLVVTMAIGSVTMSEHNCLVTNTPALQEIASMTVLCSDKTGTLTTAKMDVMNEKIYSRGGYSTDDIFEFTVACCNRNNMGDAIDGGIMRKWDTNKAGGNAAAGEKIITDHWTAGPANGFHNAAKRTVHTMTHDRRGKMMIAKGLISKILDNKATPGQPDPEEECDHPQWRVKDYDEIADEINELDVQFAKQGYKTIGVAVKTGEEWEFVGIVPMIDPPRADTALTVQRIREAGVEVKMITGDHQNIAKTTAGLINLGTNIQVNTVLQNPNVETRKKLIREADGFASVMPTDKMEVVLALQAQDFVTGFSGDGVNDVPALSAAETGVAVHGATDAANAVADLQLLSPGLSAIYTAIVESRKIFRRLKAYVIYRVAATVQIVLVLAIITLYSGCMMDAIYIIILAIMNDLTMMPLSSDRQKAAKNPEKPVIWTILLESAVFGVLEAIMSLAFFYATGYTTVGSDKYKPTTTQTPFLANAAGATQNFVPQAAPRQRNILEMMSDGNNNSPFEWSNYKYMTGGSDHKAIYDYCMALIGGCVQSSTTDLSAFKAMKHDGKYVLPGVADVDKTCFNYDNAVFCDLRPPGMPWAGDATCPCTEIMTCALFIQIFVSAELLIFPMRSLGWFWTSMAAPLLYVTVIGACVLFTILAAFGAPEAIFRETLGWHNAAWSWLWAIIGLFIMDCAKKALIGYLEGSTEEIEYETVDVTSEENRQANYTRTSVAVDVARRSMASGDATAMLRAASAPQAEAPIQRPPPVAPRASVVTWLTGHYDAMNMPGFGNLRGTSAHGLHHRAQAHRRNTMIV